MERHWKLAIPIILILVATVLGACAPAAPAEETTLPAEEETTAPPAPKPEEVERRETVIFDIDGGRVVAPDLWNPFVPGMRLDQGFFQAMIEPVFILNSETGEIEPYLGESYESNKEMTEWTIKLHKGIEWSDGTPLTADDVVFTIQMLLDNLVYC